MSDKLTKIEPGFPTVSTDAPQPGGDIESLLRFAVEKGAGVETIERMMAVRRELRAEQAKAAFDTAMAALQAEMPVIGRRSEVHDNAGKLAYKYAPFEDIIEVAKPYLQKHGFSYMLDNDVTSEAGWVIAKCRVTHAGGHSETPTLKLPLSAGTRMMSTTQIYAATLTFASRRVFQNAFGIVTANEDKNGITQRDKPKGPSSVAPENLSLKELARELWDLLKPVRGAEKNWKEANQFLWDQNVIGDQESAPEFTAARFREIIIKTTAELIKLNKIKQS